jgi:Zn-dependent protease
VALRDNFSDFEEVKSIIIADAVLILAFSLSLSGGLAGLAENGGIGYFLQLIPMVALGVTLSFVLHELMHKFVAQHYGAIAGFRTSVTGLAITLLTSTFGVLFGIPGATMIYASRFTKKENGLVSLAGPMTNFVVFVVFAALLYAASPRFFVALFEGGNPSSKSYLVNALDFTMFISILLAFFNMLPITPLDGSKILAWSKPVFALVMGVIFVLMWLFFSNIISLWSIVFMVLIALLFSTFYRFTL